MSATANNSLSDLNGDYTITVTGFNDENKSCDETVDITVSGLGCGGSSGSPSPGVSSATFTVPIQSGSQHIILDYHSQSIENPGPSIITLSGSKDATITYAPGTDVIQTILLSTRHVEIKPDATELDPNAFEIVLSVRDGDEAGQLIRTTRVENIEDADGVFLRMNTTFLGKTIDTEWRALSDTNWTMTTGNGLRKETLIKQQPNASEKSEQRLIEERNPAGEYVLVSNILTTKTRFAWGWEITSEVVDPEGDALLTLYDYYTTGETTGPDNSTAGIGKLQSVTRPDGSQMVYEYTTHIEITKAPFFNQPLGDVTVVTKSVDRRITTTTRHLGGVLVSKNERIYEENLVREREYLDDTRFVETVFEYYLAGGEFAGQLARQIYPNGTVQNIDRSLNNGVTTKVTEIGVASNGQVTDGERTEVVADENGNLLSSVTTQIGGSADGAVLSEQITTESDLLGRPTKISYFPSSPTSAYTIEKQYACCGLELESDRYGIITRYLRDDLEREISRTRLGITTETLRDGLLQRTVQNGVIVAESENSLSNSRKIRRSVVSDGSSPKRPRKPAMT